ncbi:MAG: hypothetical protein ACPGUE_14385 [Marinomonas sp.]|uniref:hypothetical protein n=1 Tax=unclassified Marinomonas TaxID=196814 RepID=UPI0007AF32CB|nr:MULTISPECIES: hypothetical protein [unclassified Marinomonas]KZM45692.1 hypothetical protein OA92_00300 [Marinomonas sp. SBI22]KZM46211.1 hypothetical protein OA91_04445 [Marinomonas sp. SBI8L]
MENIKLSYDFNDNSAIEPPQLGFHYVDQGNYQTLPLVSGQPLTIYSDSATSCIITLVLSQKGEESFISLAHLDSPSCIQAFFDIIAAMDADTYQVTAQGANPADNDTSKENAEQLLACIDTLGSKVISSELSILQGDPRVDNRGDFGLSFDGDQIALATNQPYKLQLFQRDPSCGGQTVYCIMRRQEQPPIQIRNASLPFTHAELVELASIAIQFRKDPSDPNSAFTNIVNLESDEIRQAWSTTPEYEAPWFSDQLKLGAAFAIAMAPVVSLSELHLNKSTPPSFSRLKSAVLSQPIKE